jgi:hypothetical protein
MKDTSAPRAASAEKTEPVPGEEGGDESRTVVTTSSTSTVKRSNVTTTMAGRGGDENAGPPYASIEAYLTRYPGPVRGYPHPLLVLNIRTMVSEEATLPTGDGKLVSQVYESWDRLHPPPPPVQQHALPPPVEELSSEQLFVSRADSDLTGNTSTQHTVVPPGAAAMVEVREEGNYIAHPSLGTQPASL